MPDELWIFRFDDPNQAAQWYAIDDVVMGGRSNSRMEASGGHARFSGVVSMENGGGFASVRSRPALYDLSAFSGLEVRLRGDGQRYKLRLRNNPDLDGINYDVEFETEKDVWQTQRFPFTVFEATFRGRRLPNAPALDRSQIRAFGLLISEEQAGPFSLELDWLRAYA